jgi:hypothetical protein
MTLNLMPFQEEPFNGDHFICEEFINLRDKYGIDTAIETGSCMYSTTKWLSKNFNNVWTVEINPIYADYGKHKIQGKANVYANVGMTSIDFIYNNLTHNLLKKEKCIFFLDAHWGENCPLLDELDGISNLGLENPPVISIHDFYTGDPVLGFDTYQNQPFNYDYVKKAVEKLEQNYSCKYDFYYNTGEKTAGAKRGIIYLTPKK